MAHGPAELRRALGRELRAALGGLRALAAEDVRVLRVALGFAAVELCVSLWDLPSSHGWENDGIAPRDLFGGLATNVTPGGAHRYPILHYVLVALLSLPALLAGVAAAALSGSSVRDAVLSVPVMTAVSLAAKLESVAMGAGILLLVSRWARRFHSPGAGLWTAALLVTCRSFTHYARTSNLDVPYLFWVTVAIDRLMAAVDSGERRDLVRFGVAAAAAVATKDQAYATFVPVVALAAVAPVLLRGLAGARAAGGRVATMALSGTAGYAVLSLAIVNPTGLVARFRVLTGTNSQDWRAYERSAAGVASNLSDLWASQPDFWWPWPLVGLAWAGSVVVARRRGAGPGPLASILPLAAGLGSVVFFSLVVARAEARFVLPLGVFLAPYGGVAAAALVSGAGRAVPGAGATLARAALLGALGFGAMGVAVVAATAWGDARRQVERFLAALPPGCTVETYGLTVYQPRFEVGEGAPYRVQRVDGTEPRRRNPLPGVTELRGAYLDVGERAPDVIVVPRAFSNRFLPQPLAAGQSRSQHVVEASSDPDATRFFELVEADAVPGYRVCLDAAPDLGPLRGVAKPAVVQGTLGTTLRVLCRSPR